MRWLVALVILVPLGAAEAEATKRPPSAKVVVDAGRPSSPFDCDTAKARQWYGSERRCLQDLCAERNRSNAYVDGPDGRLRPNPCSGGLRE